MPDLTIINNLDETIHVAFCIVAPANWKNNLRPGERWMTHLPTLPLNFQVRWAERTDRDSGTVYRSREFCPKESWEMGATIGAACAAGTASVITGVIPGGAMVASPLMRAANAGKNSPECLTKIRLLINVWIGGRRYALLGQDAKLCETRVWVPWCKHKEYSVRMVGPGQCGLWDVKESKRV